MLSTPHAPATAHHVTIRPERPRDAAAIAMLTDAVFGPGANARAAAALREGVDHAIDLSVVALVDSSIIGTCRLTPVLWGSKRILMLGPLGVSRAYAGIGIGQNLMRASVAAADEAGEDMIFLVGDLAYYKPFGFERIAQGRMILPRPVDPARVLLRERVAGAAQGLGGPVQRVAQRAGQEAV